MAPRLLFALMCAVGAARSAACEPRSQCMRAPEGESCLVESVSLFRGSLYADCAGRPHLCSKPQRDASMCPPPAMLPPLQLPGDVPTTVHKGTYFFVQRLVPFNRLHTALGDILGMRNVVRDCGQPALDGIILFDHPDFASQARSAASLKCAKMFVDFFKCNVTYAADLEPGIVRRFERGLMGIGGHDFMHVDSDCVSPGDFVTYRAEWYRAVGLDGADQGPSLPSRRLPGRGRRTRRGARTLPAARPQPRSAWEPQPCRSAFIANKRTFSNQGDVIRSLNATLTGLACPLTLVDWKDAPTMAEELGLIRDINIYITTVGTGAMNAVFLPRGSVVVNLGWLDDDPSSVDFNAPLGGFQDAFAFPAMEDVRTLYYPLPISHTVDTAILSALVSKGVAHFRDGFAVPVLRADNQDPWGQACAALFKADPGTHRQMLTDYTTHYCQKYLMKYRNVTTLGQLGQIVGGRAS